MYDLKLAWANVLARPLQALITMLVVGLAVALSVTVIQLNDGLRQGIVRASDAFGVLVVGPKGSSQQLVLSTILLQGAPVGNMSNAVFEQLEHDERVALAIPLAMGDNVGGARIIGTDHNFFELRTDRNAEPAFQLADGRLFEENFEAVLGSKAAEGTGLHIGDQFLPQHGIERGLESDAHDAPHTVVGILHPSSSPYDNAIFTTVTSVQEVHADQSPFAFFGSGETNEHTDEGEITAVLVQPTGFAEMNQLWQEFYMGNEAQAAFPGRELGGLFGLLNQGQEILVGVGYLAAIMAALTLFLAVYSATAARERLIAIMRSLGANRLTVFRVVLIETVLLALLGALVGRALGLGAAWLIASRISSESAIPIPIRYLPELEPYLWLLPLALGFVAGIIPAVQAYRVNVIERLFAA